MAEQQGIFRSVFTVRLINAFLVNTFFQPDEYFQSLEPAWQLAFGSKSGAWMTWEWHRQLRSSIHPAIFSAAYIAANNISKLLPASISRTALLVATPRIVQAVFAALGDWYTWQLARKIYPDTNIALSALLLQLLSAWQWFCSVRTFSNSLETTLTVMALYHYPWHLVHEQTPVTLESLKTIGIIPTINTWSLRASFSLAALAIVLRPTNILIWITIIGMTLTRIGLKGKSPLTFNTVSIFFREAILCGSMVLGLSAFCDKQYFGFWTFPPWNWLNFNINQNLAVFYGRNPWHYYLLQGLPLLCTTSLPLVLWALYKSPAANVNQTNTLRTLSAAVYTTILALSLISHKEVRFIYPLLPIINVLAAPLATTFLTSVATPFIPDPKPQHKIYARIAVIINIVLAIFLSFLHQSAPLNVLTHLRTEYENIILDSAGRQNDPLFALFLMPCHSTPWRSHLVHPTLHARALTCEPPLHTAPHTSERENYRDEADRFYDDPIKFLGEELFVPGTHLPRYIVGFEGIEPWLEDFLQTSQGKKLGIQLTRKWEGFNGFFNEDWRRAGKMIVWDTGVRTDVPDVLISNSSNM